MPTYTVHFGFSQRFPFSAAEAYEWCTDYDAGDIALEGLKGTRRIEWTDDDTVILTDTIDTDGRKVTKVKVVRLYPKLLFWTNTRISGPGMYSQFIYQIVPEGKNTSRLDYNGAQVEEAEKTPTASQIAGRSKQLTEEDSRAWVNLAAAMKKDLARPTSRGAPGSRAH
ncbi:MAG: hypothetical protein OK449_09610 [Thaumarchaeota archaeon]|nr:hypothetical protein [Nitrososphaerota archaeon]